MPREKIKVTADTGTIRLGFFDWFFDFFKSNRDGLVEGKIKSNIKGFDGGTMARPPIGKIISCVEDESGITVIFERNLDAINRIKRIELVINSKATDKRKVERIEKILS